MNVDVRARQAAADAHASSPEVDAQLRFADLQCLARQRRRSHVAVGALPWPCSPPSSSATP